MSSPFAPGQLEAGMRRDELQRREARRLRLINELALGEEHLGPEEQAANDLALADLIKAQLRFEKETSPGYWKRLLRALFNR